MDTLTIGSRGSDLALTQSRWVAARLLEAGVSSRIEVIRTQGDRVADVPFDQIDGKGFFTKEIEQALLEGQIDLAVHSLKDLPTESPEGLTVAAIAAREDPRDLLVIAPSAYAPAAEGLPLVKGCRVGSGAVRRRCQIATMRPDLKLVDLRGNVPTRLRKLREGHFDATLLACAGIHRLGLDLDDLESVALAPESFVPAPGQGALALQVRAGDAKCRSLAEKLADAEATETTRAERGLLSRLEGGCQLPLGAYARRGGGHLRLWVFFGGTSDAPGPQRLDVSGDSPDELVQIAHHQLTTRRGRP